MIDEHKISYLQGLCQILKPHQRPLKHIGYIDSFAISVYDIAFGIAWHAFVPGCSILGTIDDLGWLEWIVVGGCKAYHNILEAQTPGSNVVGVHSLCTLCPGHESLWVFFGDALVQVLEPLKGYTHVNNWFGDVAGVGVD